MKSKILATLIFGYPRKGYAGNNFVIDELSNSLDNQEIEISEIKFKPKSDTVEAWVEASLDYDTDVLEIANEDEAVGLIVSRLEQSPCKTRCILITDAGYMRQKPKSLIARFVENSNQMSENFGSLMENYE